RLSDSTLLTGLVSDDGLPSGTLTQKWSQLSGPGVATFSTPTTASTAVTFSTVGTYVLQLSASDGVLTSSSALAVTVIVPSSDPSLDPSPIANQPPNANAGPNRVTTLPASSVTLLGTATDDGLPSGTLALQWSKVNGPGTVTFATATNASTTATFDK